MADSTRRSVIVRMPSPLKRRLAREVERGGAGLNDLAVGVLAERYGIAFSPSGRRSTAPGASGVVVLRMPDELKRQLQGEASRDGTTITEVVVRALSERFDVRPRKDTMASTNGSSNGRARSQDKVRVAIVGVGNCANSLLQGVHYYRDADAGQFVPGLMHVDLGGYHVRDIEFTAAFDVTADKVGKDLSKAIWAHPNDTYRFADVPTTGITVSRGMT